MQSKAFVNRSRFVGGKPGRWIQSQRNEPHLHLWNQDDQVGCVI